MAVLDVITLEALVVKIPKEPAPSRVTLPLALIVVEDNAPVVTAPVVLKVPDPRAILVEVKAPTLAAPVVLNVPDPKLRLVEVNDPTLAAPVE
jgi:hypothetical protein